MGGVFGALLVLAASGCSAAARPAGATADRSGPAVETSLDDAAAAPAPPPPPAWTVRVIALEVEHDPDGARYTSWVQERYELEADGSFDYSAYFGGMPIEMNHNDGVQDWDAGEPGRAVLGAVRAILADPERLAELTPEPDDGPAPGCPGRCYHLGVEDERGDSTFLLGENGGRAHELLDGAFSALIAAFESATGRPLTPGQLPQTPVQR